MRPPQDLLDLPFSFTQLRLLTPHQFADQAKKRGLSTSLSGEELQAFHRLGLLVPFLRVRRDRRAIVAAARSGDVFQSQAAVAAPTERADLLEARGRGALFDPAAERFMGRRRRRQRVGDLEYNASEYLYSYHQLLAVPLLKQARPFIRVDGPDGRGARLDTDRFWRAFAATETAWRHSLVVALSALEPLYYPAVVRRLSFLDERDFDALERWRGGLKPGSMLRWLGVNAAWLKKTGAQLLNRADQLDPLGDWHELVREADPRSWERLMGDARSAVDLRIAAEVLLRYHDDLVAAGRAKQHEQPRRRWRSELHTRLKPTGPLDEILMRFGLSPHPRLILVVEGATEALMFPRLMAHFDVRTDRDFIAIEDREGVTKDIRSLLAYAVAPQTDLDEDGRYLRPMRPLTQALIVSDAEGPMATSADREKLRQQWIDRIERTLPKVHRTDPVRDALDRLVHVDTWGRHGDSFEFAHFTDLELARALDAIDPRPRRPTLTERRTHVADLRRRRRNIGELLRWGSKVHLADELWPVLKRKVERAQPRGTETRIPIVRVLDRAIDLAHGLPRGGVVIRLTS